VQRGGHDVGRETRLTPRASRLRSDVESSGGSPLVRIACQTAGAATKAAGLTAARYPRKDAAQRYLSSAYPCWLRIGAYSWLRPMVWCRSPGRASRWSEAASVRRGTPSCRRGEMSWGCGRDCRSSRAAPAFAVVIGGAVATVSVSRLRSSPDTAPRTWFGLLRWRNRPSATMGFWSRFMPRR